MKKKNRRNLYNNIVKCFWLVLIGGAAGWVIETIWCYFDFGKFTSRTSNLFLPFSIVWGIGMLLVTLTVKNQKDKNFLYLSVKGMIVGTVFEAACGYLGQYILGVAFWDYSGIPLNIGYYINIPFCAAWGIFCGVWGKWLYPWLDNKLEHMIQTRKVILNNLLIVIMLVTNLISGMALLRMDERKHEVPPENFAERYFDAVFTDEIMHCYFPKMKDI